jgi:Fe-S-cluster containining protein
VFYDCSVPVFCLSFHAGYRCAHSGACCTSGWAIPVEPARRQRVESAMAAGELRLPASAGGDSPFVAGAVLPDGSSILRSDARGTCACYDRDRRRCAIHGQIGHGTLPAACQHFPRVCLVDRDGTSVTLSHYCPTAARMLFTPERMEIVEAPTSFAPFALEGLEARDALPPLVRPRMLADRESYRAFERRMVSTLDEDVAPEAALAKIVEAVERIRRWDPSKGTLGDAVERAFATTSGAAAPPLPGLTAESLALDARVRRCVPADLHAPPVPADAVRAHDELVAPGWASLAAPVRRYLAAKAFANWCAYQGRGLRTVARSLVAALAVLQVEAARHCAAATRTLDASLLVEAFRSADLLLVHLASREDLARSLDGK